MPQSVKLSWRTRHDDISSSGINTLRFSFHRHFSYSENSPSLAASQLRIASYSFGRHFPHFIAFLIPSTNPLWSLEYNQNELTRFMCAWGLHAVASECRVCVAETNLVNPKLRELCIKLSMVSLVFIGYASVALIREALSTSLQLRSVYCSIKRGCHEGGD